MTEHMHIHTYTLINSTMPQDIITHENSYSIK